MEESLKRRLVGVLVLASLAVIFLPMLLDERPSTPPAIPDIPKRTKVIQFESTQLSDEVPVEIAREVVEKAEPVEKSKPVDVSKPKIVEPVAGLKAWVVKVGSFSSQENALRLVKKLRKSDLPTPDPEMVQVKGKTIYRVKVGPYLQKKRATALVQKVSKVSGLKAVVRQYP